MVTMSASEHSIATDLAEILHLNLLTTKIFYYEYPKVSVPTKRIEKGFASTTTNL